MWGEADEVVGWIEEARLDLGDGVSGGEVGAIGFDVGEGGWGKVLCFFETA